MKLKFKIQQYQTDAVQNVVKVFNGQPNKGLAEYIVDKGKTYITLNPQLHSRSATYKRNGLLIRKTAIKSSRPFQCAYYPLTP